MIYEIEYSESGKLLHCMASATGGFITENLVISPTNINLDEYYYEKEQGILMPFPPKPSPDHTFDWTTKRWEDMRTLRQIKDVKWTYIRSHRDTLESTSFPYLGKDIESDIISVLRINTAAKSAEYAISHGEDFQIEWRCLDNTLLVLDGNGMLMMPLSLASYSHSLHERANTLRSEIEMATTAEEVEAIVW